MARMEHRILEIGARSMSRIERKLWYFCVGLFIASLVGSACMTIFYGHRLSDFPMTVVDSLQRALQPDREPRRLEQVASISGIHSIRLSTTATNIIVKRNEALRDLSIVLEGSFLKTNLRPFEFKKNTTAISIKIDERGGPLPWSTFFEKSGHNSELEITLPREFSGTLEIETASGDTRLAALSLGELIWKSESGSIENRGGEIHVVRLHGASGDIDFNGESIEFYMNLLAANAHLVLEGLDHITNPKIDLQSTSGQIDLAISNKASARISMSSFTGLATSEVDLKKSMHSAGALEGQLGSGLGEIRLRSISGATRLTTF